MPPLEEDQTDNALDLEYKVFVTRSETGGLLYLQKLELRQPPQAADFQEPPQLLKYPAVVDPRDLEFYQKASKLFK